MIGAAFGKIVTSLVADIIMPPIGLAIGGVNFTDLAVQIGTNPKGAPVLFKYGIFIQTVFEFLIIALALFVVIKGINRLKRPIPRRTDRRAADEDRGPAGGNSRPARTALKASRVRFSQPLARDREIILDADAAEGAQLLDPRPVDLVAARVRARLVPAAAR